MGRAAIGSGPTYFFSMEQWTLMISFLDRLSTKSSASRPPCDVAELEVDSDDDDELSRGDRIDAATEADAGGDATAGGGPMGEIKPWRGATGGGERMVA